MGRAPCCEKMGLKKGPWTQEEDVILVDFINRHGHGNWRALPKRAGLLRCGKSCRLRWMNYLRPDIKRGNFTREEEETIITLHQELGNKWSVMAARLPGRTDNEIKNVWHTHLKRRVARNPRPEPELEPDSSGNASVPDSPAQSSSDASTTCTAAESAHGHNSDNDFLGMDETFWSEVFSDSSDFSCGSDNLFGGDLSMEDGGMDFWHELLHNADAPAFFLF